RDRQTGDRRDEGEDQDGLHGRGQNASTNRAPTAPLTTATGRARRGGTQPPTNQAKATATSEAVTRTATGPPPWWNGETAAAATPSNTPRSSTSPVELSASRTAPAAAAHWRVLSWRWCRARRFGPNGSRSMPGRLRRRSRRPHPAELRVWPTPRGSPRIGRGT